MNPKIWFSKSLLLLTFFKFCSSFDTLTPIKDINRDILVSDGKIFALGFFSPGNSSRRYVGIWYNKISDRKIVWVANRDNPINDTSGVLSINQDGNLVIYANSSQSDVSLWQTNVSAPLTGSSYSATLLDTGNLVLSHGSTVAWQSFDYPSDTMLPGMKLGLDRKTGLDWFLTSWKSKDDPGTGEVSYRMDPNGAPQMILYRGSVRLWRTGPWIDGKWSSIPKMTSDFVFNFSYADNSDELYVKYELTNISTVSILFVEEIGHVRRISWDEDRRNWVGFWSAPKDKDQEQNQYQCDSYGCCGPYGYYDSTKGGGFGCTCLPGYQPRSEHEWYFHNGSAGCVRKPKALSMCENGAGFVKVAHVKVPDTSQARLKKNSSENACKLDCWRNCSCLAYVSGSEGECITWYENLNDTRKFSSDGGSDLYIRVDAVELAQQPNEPRNLTAQQPNKSRSFDGKKVAVVVTCIVVMSLLIISLAGWLVIKRRRELKNRIEKNLNLLPETGLNIQAADEENLDLPIFNMVTIYQATNSFSDTHKIGEGGFGSVYKGQLSCGKEIAVKRLSMNSKQGLNEFKNEVILIAKLQHRNLVRLLGCCIDGEERMLVYEYMPNGSLDTSIFGPKKTGNKSLTWRRRLDIIVGIARGLLYLHQDSRLRVIHRDLKASNVLLDDDMNPKISDFGLARAVGGDQSSAITRRVVGTYGYMAPEYVVDGLFSMKSDVFSFGVLILEILSGKRNRLFQHPDHDFNLLGHAWKLWIEGKVSKLFDPLVEGSIPMSTLLRYQQVGLLCVQKCSEDRPTMSSVLLMLISEIVVLPPPNQPGFFTERNYKETDYLHGESSSSVNVVTVTQLEAR